MESPRPIHADPLLGEVFELLHRMELCRSLEPFQWMASDALKKLRAYEVKQLKEACSGW
ncbi:hypothetical protein [Paraburkholderia sp. SOS3]|uniref:hypothetical protein n=1 Tax=Paraburkholderia sp. SOS3 TaxID=1926494 RepID=UPI0012EB08C6|nr:hypothetical protein [Paraburkholderia sp. SOS3]